MTKPENVKSKSRPMIGRIVTVRVQFKENKLELEQEDFEFPEDKTRMDTLEHKKEKDSGLNEKKRKHVEHHRDHHGDHPLILLSVSDGDQIRWVGPEGGFEVKIAKDNSLNDGEVKAPENPFGWREDWRSDGGTGELVSGPALKGAAGELIVKQGQYKFSLHSTATGVVLDPNVYFCP